MRETLGPTDSSMSDIDYQEIIKTVIERGSMTRTELLEAWGLDTDQYAELRKRARSHPEVRPRRGREGGLEVVEPSGAEVAGFELDESPTRSWNEEDLQRMYELLVDCRTIAREVIYEEMDLDESEDYSAFLDDLEEYVALESHVLDRKKGLGGIELLASPEEIYQRLQDRADRTMSAPDIKALTGWEYKDFVEDLQRIAEEDGQRLIRHKGKGGVTLAASYEDLVREIATEGRMPRAQLLTRLGLEAEDYPRAVENLYFAAREQGIKLDRAQGRGGGLTAHFENEPAAETGARTTGPTADRLDLEPWQQAAVELLIELGPARLEEFVGPALYNTIRSVEKSRSSYAMAAALVLRHGLDLLAEKDIREAVAELREVDAPQRWRAGGRAAQEFVEALGLPSRFSGEKRDEREKDIEQLEGRTSLRGLEDYQLSVKDQLLVSLGGTDVRAMVSLPTGAGKTRVAVETLRDLLTREYSEDSGRRVVLWLAHTEELCEQACQCIRQVWSESEDVCPLSLVRFWGHYSDFSKKHEDVVAQLDKSAIIVSTPQRLDNIRHKSRVEDTELAQLFLTRLRTNLRLILIDEAHRAAAPIYRRIVEHFQEPEAALIGMTATPFRNVATPELGAHELQEIFGSLIEPKEIDGHREPDSQTLRAALQQRGVLAQPRFSAIESNVSLGRIEASPNPDLSEIEAIDAKLARRADNPRRRAVVLEKVLEIARDPERSVIYFGPTVNDAEIMGYLLLRRGVTAAVISGSSKEASRRQAIADFKRGRIQVLCNCEVLTTGFDHPRITDVVIARPTMSQVLYEQMVGRGLRGSRFGGTDTCGVLDVEDSFPGGRRPTLGFDRFRDVWSETP